MKKSPASRIPNDTKKRSNEKTADLAQNVEDSSGQFLTTNHGLKINDDQNALKAGERGPSLLEDFVLREKITHFDHERIPERIVHARGSGAHGHFQVYKSMSAYTRAGFLNDPALKTPVFVRFSTVAGSRGSSDLARDVRGFAVKFYTQEGNYDLVGNNMPVFFIQDAMKFPDLIHAVKPEPHNEMPQAASAHDNFWDFISLTPEAAHMIIWVMSDRAIPRSLRMMEGFGIHSFRFINERDESHFVKFHWKPLLGIHSVLWDEAQLISGRDPDFHRRDLWEAIENRDFPEWELGVQLVPEKDEHKFDFDLLDPTKLIPEELVPVQRIGKMTLNRNPDNFFAETEQVAFHPGHLVPGIDLTNDPLLQGRLFSYTDTQLLRLGGPNFHEIPINRPVVPIHNAQRDGIMRHAINKGRVAYEPNTLANNDPAQAKVKEGGFASFMERMSAFKVRSRSKSFVEHFAQAAMFFHSQSAVEQKHIINALRFELGKVETKGVRERMLFLLSQVDGKVAEDVAAGLGMEVPSKIENPLNQNIPADANPKDYQSKKFTGKPVISPALSMAGTIKTPKTRKIAALINEGFDDAALLSMKKTLKDAGVQLKTIAPHGGTCKGSSGTAVPVDHAVFTVASVLFDGVYVPVTETSIKALVGDPKFVEFLKEAFKHCKPIAATEAGESLKSLFPAPQPPGKKPSDSPMNGVLLSNDPFTKKVAADFIECIAQHRAWERERA